MWKLYVTFLNNPNEFAVAHSKKIDNSHTTVPMYDFNSLSEVISYLETENFLSTIKEIVPTECSEQEISTVCIRFEDIT